MTEATMDIKDLAEYTLYGVLSDGINVLEEYLPDASEETLGKVSLEMLRIIDAGLEAGPDKGEADFERLEPRVSALGRDGGEAPLNDGGVAELDRIFGYREPRVGDYVACKYDGDFGTVTDISARDRGTVYEIAWAGHEDFTTWEHADALRVVGEKC